MLSVIFWVAFGITIGWVVAILREVKGARGYGIYLATGGIGGFLGGRIDQSSATYSTATTDIMFAVFGSIALLIIISLASRLLHKVR